MRQRGFEFVSCYVHSGLSLPVRKTQASAGYDIAAAEDAVIHAKSVCLVPTGLKAYMPADEYLSVHVRSGLSVKQKLSLINGQGIIDSDYYNNPDNEGHIFVALYNHSDQDIVIVKGMRIAQGIFLKYLVADHEGTVTNTRIGGFGSTGVE